MLVKIDQIIDIDKPILITGWNKVKELYPNQKITKKQISDKIFWTFSEKEKRTENNKDIENFKKFCFKEIENKYNYYFLNPFELNYTKIKRLINKINIFNEDKFYHFDGKHFFILVDDYIFGLNLEFLDYTKITENKLKKWLKLKKFEIIENSKIFNKEEMNNKKYLIPILGKNRHEEQFIIGYIFE